MSIKRVKKNCKGCELPQYLFSHGLCLMCYNKSKMEAPTVRKIPFLGSNEPVRAITNKSKGKAPPRRVKPNKTDIFLQEHWGYKSQVELFEDLWDASPEKCQFTGENLSKYKNTDRKYHCCAHILPKGKWPWFKLNIENVLLVSPEFHRLVDQGTEAERSKHPNWRFDMWYKKVDSMKREYEKFKKDHLL